MKRNILNYILLAISLFILGSVSGQTFTKITADNAASLGVDESYVDCWLMDCTMIQSKRVATASLTALGDDFYEHWVDNTSVNRVYPKLIIADQDLPPRDGYDGISVPEVREDAVDYRDEDGWRLPTLRELLLIFILASYLDGGIEEAGFTEFVDPSYASYWSASIYMLENTGYDDHYCRMTVFYEDYVSASEINEDYNDYPYQARLVKEVNP